MPQPQRMTRFEIWSIAIRPLSIDEARCHAAPAVHRDVEDVGAAVVPGGVEVVARLAYRRRVDVDHDEPLLVGDRLDQPAAVRCGYGGAASAVFGDTRLFELGSHLVGGRLRVERDGAGLAAAIRTVSSLQAGRAARLL